MINLLLFPVFFELMCVSIATAWLYKLYVNNQSYIRDVFMLVGCHLNGYVNSLLALWVITQNDKYIKYAAPLIILNYSVISTYLMSNVKESSTKWLANVLKSLVLTITVFALVTKISTIMQFSIAFIIIIDFFFACVNNNSITTKLSDLFVGIASFAVVYCYELCIVTEEIPMWALCTAILLLNVTQLAYAYHRIGDVVEMITPEKSFRLKMRNKKEQRRKVKQAERQNHKPLKKRA